MPSVVNMISCITMIALLVILCVYDKLSDKVTDLFVNSNPVIVVFCSTRDSETGK